MRRIRWPRREEIGAVVVTHFPDTAFEWRLERVKNQVIRVIVVDNSCGPEISKRLRRALGSLGDLIENDQNVGVAAALNQGIHRAREVGLAWTVLLDQDSEVDADMVERLAEICGRHSHPDTIGIVAAKPRNGRLAEPPGRSSDAPSRTFLEVKTVITSGSLMPICAFERAGPFREDFFIDGVDLEYCLRLRRCGFIVLQSQRALMTHVGGSGEKRRFLGRVVLVGNHEPWRYYYMLRNFVHIAKAYSFREPAWFLQALINLVKTLAKVLLYERQKTTKVMAVVRGVIDGLCSWDGPGVPPHARRARTFLRLEDGVDDVGGGRDTSHRRVYGSGHEQE